ncbi:discoidin domain-containing protein [Pyxidicoccus xibeiensis]|uniref:discoidin domain-containing protein n=1 Tax=Pyxidicoccus xibeiensis TaxID=2906759 RepID=UPI0020A800F0|nr:discoidin domain-containing protein [Pyxidicoccus xibeiensis]MCP3140514.1 discoidin domain-containing protein [Pyxidicoccus xibeiensis]
MQPEFNCTGRSTRAALMLALSWLAWGCGGEGSVREGPEGTQHVGLESCATVAPTGVTASGDDGNVPQNVLDGLLSTRWSSLGAGQFITADLGSVKTVCSVSVAWYRGDVRRNTFTLSVSEDGSTFTEVFSGQSSGTSAALETYDIPDGSARYVRVTVNGNTDNLWASVSELGVQGSSTTPPPPPPTGTCDRTATTAATLASQWSAATAGQTICLATGSYGTFAAGSKSGVVTVKPQSGATATLALRFNGANNVRIEGLTITSAALLGSTRNVTITGSRFTGAATIDGVVNANILFDGNTHLNLYAPPGSTPARIHLPYSSATHSGVTIQNSRFEGGDADGIQTGVGVNILNNLFKDIQESGPNHTDSVQLLGAPGSVVRGNYFLNCVTGIVAYDGVERALIEDNVLDLRGRPWAIELYSDNGSIIRHNTLMHGTCAWNLPCGIIDITRKTADAPGQGTVIVDNVATEISVSNGSTVAERHHNLLRRGAQSGELTGAPVFVGGAQPTDRAGFRLATGSPGKGAASDGTDIGIR